MPLPYYIWLPVLTSSCGLTLMLARSSIGLMTGEREAKPATSAHQGRFAPGSALGIVLRAAAARLPDGRRAVLVGLAKRARARPAGAT